MNSATSENTRGFGLESLARRASSLCAGMIARELSLLPITRRGRRSWSSWFSTTLLTTVSQGTAWFGETLGGWRRGWRTPPVPQQRLPMRRLAPMATPVPLSKEQSDRKMALLKRSGLFGGDTGGARITRAATLEDLRAAYKLVHKVYLGTGFIKAEDAGMRLRIFETTSDTATFIAKKDGKVVGVLSIIEDTPELGLPSDSAFKEELDVLRAMGRKLGEVTNQAVDEEFRKTALPTELMRCAIAHGFEMGFDMGIATVSPSHNGFYELLGFRPLRLEDEPWSGPRSYSNKLHDPVVALRINLNDYRRPANETEQVERFVHKFLGEENPYTAYVSAWEERARRSFLHADLLEELFVRERNFLAECTADELKVLERRWGRELFRVVTSDQFLPVLDGLGVVAPKPDGIGKRETPPPPGQN